MICGYANKTVGESSRGEKVCKTMRTYKHVLLHGGRFYKNIAKSNRIKTADGKFMHAF